MASLPTRALESKAVEPLAATAEGPRVTSSSLSPSTGDSGGRSVVRRVCTLIVWVSRISILLGEGWLAESGPLRTGKRNLSSLSELDREIFPAGATFSPLDSTAISTAFSVGTINSLYPGTLLLEYLGPSSCYCSPITLPLFPFRTSGVAGVFPTGGPPFWRPPPCLPPF